VRCGDACSTNPRCLPEGLMNCREAELSAEAAWGRPISSKASNVRHSEICEHDRSITRDGRDSIVEIPLRGWNQVGNISLAEAGHERIDQSLGDRSRDHLCP
jgi:hypothetical protein